MEIQEVIYRYKLYKKRYSLNYGKYSFGNRVVNEWNSLPEYVMMAKDVNEFKRGIDHHLGHIRGLN